VISKSDVKSLAEADEQEVVAEVQVNSNVLSRSPNPKASAKQMYEPSSGVAVRGL